MRLDKLVVVVCPNHDGFHTLGHDKVRYAFFGNGYCADDPTFSLCRQIMKDWGYNEVETVYAECASCKHKRGH